jgi:hypothetical protein
VVTYLISLNTTHKKIRDAANTLQRVYALVNLIIILKGAISSTAAIHYLLDIRYVHYNESIALINKLEAFWNIFINGFYIVTLTLISSRTADEVIVYKRNLTTFDRIVLQCNKMAKLQLRLSTKSRLVAIKIWNFVLQSKHEKLTFTCFNLFDINETLFCTVGAKECIEVAFIDG